LDSDDKTNSFFMLRPGLEFSHYRLIERVGAGGMGEVYLADDTKLRRRVALKFLPATMADDPEARQRFMREAQAAAALNHPNIVHIYEVSEFEKRPYFAMEYVDGQLLHEFAHEDTLSLDKLLDLIIQLCEGLAEAHSHGVVHRDIKAANIVVDRKGRTRILDFGLATIKGDVKLTKTGSTLGTVAYMSPEQVSGKEVDRRSDLFSLGVVIYELLAGRTPFKREGEAATLQAIVNDSPQPLTRYRSDLPDRLITIVDKLLNKNPDLRYQTADGVLPDLRSLKSDHVSGSTRTMTVAASPKSRTGLYSVMAALVVVVAALVVWQPWKSTGEGGRVPMIAVLPFENLGAAEDAYFADGMTEEVTSRLVAIKGLGVISRTSAIKANNLGLDIAEIGEELGVDYVLEGTVRWSKSGGKAKVRITPQLIRVSDNSHTWTDIYERDFDEVFEVQADIAMQIVSQLDLTLLESDRKQLQEHLTDSEEAYAFYLKGVQAVKSSEGNDALRRQAVAHLDSAIAYDPNFAQAYAYKSIAHSSGVFASYGWTAQNSDQPRLALEAARKALALNPQLSLGHLALGTYYNYVERDYDLALDEFAAAQSEIHSDADLIAAIAYVHLRQGLFLEAQAGFRKAVELDPLNAFNHFMLANCLSFTRDFEEALAVAERAISLDPDIAQYYSVKLRILICGYGAVEGVVAMLNELPGQVEPIDVIGWEYVPFGLFQVSADSVITRYAGAARDSVPPGMSYVLTLYACLGEGNTDLARVYCDSAASVLETLLPVASDHYDLHAYLGVSYACLGETDRAIEEGLKAKELMSVYDCHW